jgi:hypothetical protein
LVSADVVPPMSSEVMARGEKIKDGRHVGLDFYDLLIEALMLLNDPAPSRDSV